MIRSYGKTRIACYVGYTVQAIINNFLPILFIVFQEKYDLNYEQLGRIVFINFFIQIFADFLTPKIVKYIGYKGSAILCHGLAAFGLILVSILPNIIPDFYASLVIAVAFYAFGSGIIEVVISPMIEMLPLGKKGANMAFLHSFYCWGQAFTVLGTTALIFLLGFESWTLVPLAWAIVPLANMFFFMTVPVIEPESGEDKKTAKDMFKSREFFCFVVFMVCAGASEIAMSSWASMFAQKGLNVSKTVGDLLGPCAFAIFMGSGRIIGGVLSGRISYRKMIIFNNILCVGCYLGAALLKNPFLALIACAVCGFAVSISWPGTFSLAATRFPHGGTLMFSILALCGDLGCSSGPWLLGTVADITNLNTGFIVSCIFPIAMLIVAIFVLKEKDCKLSEDILK